MKRSGLSRQIASATLFLLSVAAWAAEDKPAAGAPDGRLADLMKRFDKDGDGKLDDAERAEAKEALIREGADPQQLRQMAAAAAGAGQLPQFVRERLLALFDRNGDGRLDDDERAAAQKFAVERGFSDPAAFRDEILRRFDQNHNGRIDPEERAAVQAFVLERLSPAKAAAKAETVDPLELVVRAAIAGDPEQLKRFDANHDGKLDDAEWQNARHEVLRVFSGSASERP